MSVYPLRLKHRHEPALDPSILHVLPANIAVLGGDGTILAVNEAWEPFAAANGFTGEAYGVGLNCLRVCDRAGTHPDAMNVAEGIRHTLDGTIRAFSYEYESSSPFLGRCFRVIVTPCKGTSVMARSSCISTCPTSSRRKPPCTAAKSGCGRSWRRRWTASSSPSTPRSPTCSATAGTKR